MNVGITDLGNMGFRMAESLSKYGVPKYKITLSGRLFEILVC